MESRCETVKNAVLSTQKLGWEGLRVFLIVLLGKECALVEDDVDDIVGVRNVALGRWHDLVDGLAEECGVTTRIAAYARDKLGHGFLELSEDVQHVPERVEDGADGMDVLQIYDELCLLPVCDALLRPNETRGETESTNGARAATCISREWARATRRCRCRR